VRGSAPAHAEKPGAPDSFPRTAQPLDFQHPDAEGVEEFFPKQSLRNSVERQRPMAREVDESSARIQLQEFLQVESLDAQTSPQAGSLTLACPQTETEPNPGAMNSN
jgi:hypothetical protein